MNKPVSEKFILYKNAFEMRVVEEENDEGIVGWCELIRQDKFIVETIMNMISNIDNLHGKRIARMFTYFKKQSLVHLGECVLDGRFKFEYRNKKI